MSIAAYSKNLPCYPMDLIATRIKQIRNGYKVQYRHYWLLGSFWRTATDTHPGHGATIPVFKSFEGANSFQQELRKRLERI